MRLPVGTDTSKFPRAGDCGPVALLERVHALGLDGAFFRSAFELSATLDPAELADVASAGRDLGLYLEVGTAKVNPFATPEAPQIRALGDGDYLRGLERIIRAVSAVGITELWTATANYQFRISGLFACDRFRTDVDWADQLAATLKVLKALAPILRETGAHLNIETHEEITSFEVVRLVEAAGPDAFGITFDTANVLVRAEDPVAAARRVAPYTRQTQVRDVALVRTEDGLGRFLAPVGDGVIDWTALLAVLAEANPALTLSIEGVTSSAAEMSLFTGDQRWWAGHPDLTAPEFAAVLRLADAYERQVADGQRPGLAQLRGPIDETRQLEFITASASRLRDILASLPAAPAPAAA